MKNFKYFDKNTPIHRLNPFCKVAWAASVFILALVFDHPYYILLLFLSTLPVIAMADSWREWASFMKLVIFFGILIVVINALVIYQGTTVLFEIPIDIPALGPPKITLEAIFFGLMMTLRIMAITSAFSVINLTIHSDDLMLVLLKMKFPYKSVLVTSLSTQFVPRLADDIARIMDVQRSRGVETDRGSALQKARGRAGVLIPFLSNSLERTVQIAEAMEARGFGQGKDRTYYKEIKLTRFDAVTLVVALLPLVYGIWLRIAGYGAYQYYPTLGSLIPSAREMLLMLPLAVLLNALPVMASLKGVFDLD